MDAWIKQVSATFAGRPGLVDGVLAAVLLAACLTRAQLESREVGARPGDVLPPEPLTLWVGAAIVAIVVPLAWRRRAPLTVLALSAGAGVASFLLLRFENEITGVAIMFALYSASAYGRKPWRTWLWGIALAAVVAAATYRITMNQPEIDSWLYSLHYIVWGVAAYVVGNNLRIGRAREAELRTRTAQLAVERETNARRAVLEERVRVARELHDVIAHGVSLMGIQAAAAQRVLAIRPEQAARALAAIERISRQAVGELQQMLGFLRQDEADALTPPPSLRRLDDLITELFDPSLAVQVHLEGQQQTLPTSVDLSAYRIVQEALTNTLKHAKATTVSVNLRYRETVFEVEVVDNGVQTAAVPCVANGSRRHGLIGMRERVILHDGQFEAGPRSEGGFGVRASFPLLPRS